MGRGVSELLMSIGLRHAVDRDSSWDRVGNVLRDMVRSGGTLIWM
jgi:hypothetical protein